MNVLTRALGRLLVAIVGERKTTPPRSRGDHGASDWYVRH